MRCPHTRRDLRSFAAKNSQASRILDIRRVVSAGDALSRDFATTFPEILSFWPLPEAPRQIMRQIQPLRDRGRRSPGDTARRYERELTAFRGAGAGESGGADAAHREREARSQLTPPPPSPAASARC